MKEINEKYFVDSSNNAHEIEDVLTSGEQILWRAKPQKKAYVWSNVLQMLPIALIWLIFDSVFIFAFAINGGKIPAYVWFIFVPFMLVHLTPVWIWIANIVKASVGHKNVEYVFTDKRIIIKSGVVGIDFKNVYYSDINSVNVKVGIIDKILNVGDIYIKSNNGAVVLFDLEKPYIALTGLQKISLDIKSDIYFPNDLRPDTNAGYNTQYKPMIDNQTSEIEREEEFKEKNKTTDDAVKNVLDDK